jgi:hypothetical protein
MIVLLDPDADLDYIQEKARRESQDSIVREYLANRRSVLRLYLRDLMADYENLYKITAVEAVHDPILAAKLLEWEREFRDAVRSIRGRLWLESIFPRAVVRRLFSGAFSRAATDRLLARMDSMRARII